MHELTFRRAMNSRRPGLKRPGLICVYICMYSIGLLNIFILLYFTGQSLLILGLLPSVQTMLSYMEIWPVFIMNKGKLLRLFC